MNISNDGKSPFSSSQSGEKFVFVFRIRWIKSWLTKFRIQSSLFIKHVVTIIKHVNDLVVKNAFLASTSILIIFKIVFSSDSVHVIIFIVHFVLYKHITFCNPFHFVTVQVNKKKCSHGFVKYAKGFTWDLFPLKLYQPCRVNFKLSRS